MYFLFPLPSLGFVNCDLGMFSRKPTLHAKGRVGAASVPQSVYGTVDSSPMGIVSNVGGTVYRFKVWQQVNLNSKALLKH